MGVHDRLEYIRRTYQVPAYLYIEVEVEWQEGERVRGFISGAHCSYIKVQIDRPKIGVVTGTYHPTWRVTYFPAGCPPVVTGE